ncbi:glycosyltransferase involved in cell wall biosynthesis [Povalibacter uvarum]|uniref:Glycosyltransferase involved in cell wall biosynthesis n=1 Tax=Povalibacter uvarum TaxID=732238 RepID=A0A841HH44_9GAMM|nr:glycosyltransferase family 2 protein [Povalibacter uvarum]MBB6091650.1 glycosyltransferase involved in cell wall biosynthesis [Povalibacter uvarum]
MKSTQDRPLVTIILPAYNEAAVLEENVGVIEQYLRTLESRYRFEIVIVNDGSRDGTAEIAERLESSFSNLRVLHHPTNFGLGQAFKTGFGESRGDYVVTMDVDLSYAPDHIGLMLDKIVKTRAKLVLASPYMEGGQLTNVPAKRKFFSIWGNRFLRAFARGNASTITCMVRAYDGPFIRALSLRSLGMDVMPETVYKTMVLRGLILEVPAHLDWTRQIAAGPQRQSSMRILRHIFSTILSGFLFRPFMFLVVPGLVMLAFSMWVNIWMIVHFFEAYLSPDAAQAADRISAAVSMAYQRYPHTFLVGLLSLMVSIQLIGLGAIALQAKNYFEELFHQGSVLRRRVDQLERD